MTIIYSTKFAKEYRKLPLKIKLLAEKKEKVFRQNPYQASLKTHKLTGSLAGYSAFSINYQYRIIFEFRENDEVWFHAVGTHAIYTN